MDLTSLMAGIGEAKMDSRYRLVIVTAQRARQMIEGSKPLTQSRFSKEITVALDEVLQGQIKYLTGSEAQAALKEARQKGALLKPKALPGRPEDVSEVKKDLTQYVDDSLAKQLKAPSGNEGK